jgi:TonB family protein
MNAATYSLLAPRPSKLMPYLAASLVGHLVVVLGFLVLSWVLAGPRMDLEQKPIKATLVRLGKERDDKLLPRKEEAPPEAKKDPVKVPTPDAPVPIPSKDARKPAEKKNTQKSLSDAFSKASSKPEELEGKADGDVNGDSAREEGERYYGLLTSVVKRNYDVSDTIPEAERRTLAAVVAIRIGTGGELLEAVLKKSSGNQLFDGAVVTAVKKAAPFSPPPPHLKDALKSTGVAFSFTP